MQPFAHHLIREALLNGEADRALSLARTAPFRRRYSLELLLHEALLAAHKADKTSSAKKGEAGDEGTAVSSSRRRRRSSVGSGYLFVHVASLVRDLGVPSASRVIIANCARKTDAIHWGRLFAACGQPSDILQAALDAGDVSCAAALLLPLRHASGDEACERALTQVRELAEARNAVGLMKQLNTFHARLLLERQQM